MLVEINLLPQKEPKKIGFIITLSCLLALLLLSGGYYLWQINSTKTDMASIDRQLSMTKKIAEKQTNSTDLVQSVSSVSQLKDAIAWANDYPIQTIPVMRQLTSLLPERGFIQSFGYTETGTVTLTVQFDSVREAAYFLENLNDSKWIEEASLNSLSAATATESTSTSTTTTQTNTTNPSADASNQTNTTNSNTNTGATTPTEGQTTNAATGTPVDPNSTVKMTTNNLNNAAVNSNNTTSKTVDNNILPRYTGQFEIKLNKDTVKKMTNESKKNEEGVTGS
jgi:Tfp pilus assembly protein PilN